MNNENFEDSSVVVNDIIVSEFGECEIEKFLKNVEAFKVFIYPPLGWAKSGFTKVKKDGKINYKCDTCDKQFPVVQRVKVHLRFHFINMMHKCKICFKSFPLSRDLKKHIWNAHT